MKERERRRLLLLPLLVLFLLGARQRPIRHPGSSLGDLPDDIFSYAEPSRVTTRHLSLDLAVDFDSRRISGTATLFIENLTGTPALVLDTRDLDIFEVSVDGRAASWNLDPETRFGRALRIGIEPSTQFVTIRYATRPSAAGLHWMSPMQSYGRRWPYLYSQNEPDFARSWIPVQDTPAVLMTYEATVRVPSQLLALMSAENPTARRADGVYSFHMRQPVPAYLIALAVGPLEFRALDNRTGVYGEPELLADAEWELQYIPGLVNAAERVIAPYPWGRYDVLLMPPTYVVGGMEHPTLNFINPFAVVTGNRPAQPRPSLLIAHELAHSWAGDLATLATWSDVWINEGITSYLTLRIMEEVLGEEYAELSYFLDRSSYYGYANQVEDLRFTVLHREFQAEDPAFSAFDFTAYTKGELFMKTLEDRLGRATFDAFLRQYFQRFAYRWVDDRAFLALLRETSLAGRPELEAQLRLEEWIYGVGLPDNVTAPQSSRIYDRVALEVAAFRTGTQARDLRTTGWTDTELGLFLSRTSNEVRQRMAEVDAAFGLSMRSTPPFQWLLPVAQTQYQPGLASLERVLMRGGPNSWIRSLYDALSQSPSGRAIAIPIYQRARERYDPGVQQFVDELLFGQQAKLAA